MLASRGWQGEVGRGGLRRSGLVQGVGKFPTVNACLTPFSFLFLFVISRGHREQRLAPGGIAYISRHRLDNLNASNSLP